MKFTLRQLEVFAAVARSGSILKAADALSLSQSATSAALQELENRYNTQFFERKGKRLQLNTQGKTLRKQAELLLIQAKALHDNLTQDSSPQVLNIGCSYTIGNYLAFEHVARFNKAYPNTRVDIAVGSTPEIVDKVLNFEVELGLVEGELHHAELEVTPWRADNMIAFCAPEHPFANKRALTDKDILNCEWLLREPGSGHRQTFDRAMQGLLPQLNIRAELTQNEAIKHAAKEGLGIGCLSEIAVQEDIKTGALHAITLKNRAMDRYFYIVRRLSDHKNDALEWWMS